MLTFLSRFGGYQGDLSARAEGVETGSATRLEGFFFGKKIIGKKHRVRRCEFFSFQHHLESYLKKSLTDITHSL